MILDPTPDQIVLMDIVFKRYFNMISSDFINNGIIDQKQWIKIIDMFETFKGAKFIVIKDPYGDQALYNLIRCEWGSIPNGVLHWHMWLGYTDFIKKMDEVFPNVKRIGYPGGDTSKEKYDN